MTFQDNIQLTTEPTTLSSWALAICRTIDSYDVDSKALLQQLGINPELLQDPNGRIPTSQVTQLWALAVTACGDESIGLKVANFVQPTSFNALSFSLLVSESLADAWIRIKRYYEIISNVLEMEIVEGELESALCFNRLAENHYAFEAIDAFMATSYLMPLQVSHGQIKPVRLELERPSPADVTPFESLFSCPIHFNADSNRIYFSNESLNTPFPSANRELAIRNDAAIEEYLNRLSSQSFSSKVAKEIVISMSLGNPDREAIAKVFHMSSRNLQRKLKLENTTFSDQLDLIRKRLALTYILESELAIIEISFRLGFKDPSNFTRAFKRWYKKSPLQYRKQG
ncbi:AraC family transcriptional regulator [Shewanella sp. UCD-KL12]|uniref:AraC family transcriptional regulator n=1 Tax=Shewanella sp. UCD-KL12 TaxID=1917163 RepID=UPI000970B13E|nr:AraC family transcriptional regulator [Shewanella sp. UCD-KL12]